MEEGKSNVVLCSYAPRLLFDRAGELVTLVHVRAITPRRLLGSVVGCDCLQCPEPGSWGVVIAVESGPLGLTSVDCFLWYLQNNPKSSKCVFFSLI